MPYGKKKSKPFKLRTSSSKLLNFVAMFCGFVLACILLLMLIGKLFQQKPVAIPEKPSSKVKIETDITIATSYSLDLASKLSSMASAEKTDSLPVQTDHLRKKVKIADQLLILEHTESEKELAILAKIDSLAGLVHLAIKNQFDLPKEEQQLNETFEKYQTDQNERIQKRIQLTRFRLNGLIAAKKEGTDSSDLQSLATEVKPLLQSDLDLDEQEHLKETFISISDIDKFFREELDLTIFRDGVFEKLNTAARELRDRAKIEEYELNKNAIGVINDQPEAKESTFQAARKIAKDPAGGQRIISELISILSWIEQIQELKIAREIYQLLIDSAPARSTPDLTKMAMKLGKDGIRRCDFVGKTFSFEGLQLKNENIKPESFSNHWVLILFMASETSVDDVMGQNEVKRLTDQGFKVLVAKMIEGQESGNESEGEEFSVNSVKNVSRILDQYPAQLLPQGVLINPSGKVIRTAIPMRSLSTLALQAKDNESNRQDDSKSED